MTNTFIHKLNQNYDQLKAVNIKLSAQSQIYWAPIIPQTEQEYLYQYSYKYTKITFFLILK